MPNSLQTSRPIICQVTKRLSALPFLYSITSTHPRPGERHSLTAPAPSRAIRGVLDRFADLPQEAENEIRGPDEARRRIAELERQIKHLKAASGAPQIDQVAVDRAVKSAIE
jgi:hypothetical protein